MKNLRNLLERFSNSLNKDVIQKETVISTVHNIARVKLTEDNISIKNGVLEITTGAAAKNEIVLKEDAILGELRSRGVNITRFLFK